MRCFGSPIPIFNRSFTPARLTKPFGAAPAKAFTPKPHAWLDAIHPEDRFGVIEARKARTDVVCELEYRIVRPDGTVRWIRDRAFPVHDAAGRVIRMAGVAEDVTERRQLEMQLRQAQKMEAIGQLAAGVAHDFNNLLSVISGHSELLAMLSPSDDRWRDSIAEIRRATELGSAAIRQLLAFSCQQILEPKVLDLNAVVAEAEKMLRRLIGEDVHLVTLLQPRISPVRADLGQLNQVILNLAVNSSRRHAPRRQSDARNARGRSGRGRRQGPPGGLGRAATCS